jgi:DNA-binding CsgD family transcriptional regulator
LPPRAHRSRQVRSLASRQTNSRAVSFPGWVADHTNRLFDLFSECTAVRQDSRALVSQLRGTIHEMRQLRGQLRTWSTTTVFNGARTESNALEHRYGLTPRELEVAKLLARGKSNAAIAEELRISAHTARHHTQRILSKLAVHSRAEAGAKLRE